MAASRSKPAPRIILCTIPSSLHIRYSVKAVTLGRRGGGLLANLCAVRDEFHTVAGLYTKGKGMGLREIFNK